MKVIKREFKVKEYIRYDGCEYRRDETIDHNGKVISLSWHILFQSGFGRLSDADIGNLELNKLYKVLERDNKIDNLLK